MALFVSLTNGLASPVARKRKTRNPLPRPLLIALSDRLTKAKINKREKKGKIKEFPIPLRKKFFFWPLRRHRSAASSAKKISRNEIKGISPFCCLSKKSNKMRKGTQLAKSFIRIRSILRRNQINENDEIKTKISSSSLGLTLFYWLLLRFY